MSVSAFLLDFQKFSHLRCQGISSLSHHFALDVTIHWSLLSTNYSMKLPMIGTGKKDPSGLPTEIFIFIHPKTSHLITIFA